MQAWSKIVAGAVMALGLAALTSGAQAAPAASGTVGVERAAPASVVEQAHYRRYRHCHRHRGHMHCHGGRHRHRH